MNGQFDLISPLDCRYKPRDRKLQKKFAGLFSENARVKYQAQVELAYIKALHKKKIVSRKTVDEIKRAVEKITAKEVYEKERILKHDVKALVESIKKRVKSKEGRKFIHVGLTSYDIVDTANALRFKKATEEILIPLLIEFEKELIKISLREKNTLQIGRTHGQHAEPITFGFFTASYVDRIGNSLTSLVKSKNELKGKISGAVGAYNALNLLYSNPEEIERLTLKELGLKPCSISTQILEPEALLDLMHELTKAFGIIANLSDDLRNLQRSEIAEVCEGFGRKQVGSSTMPHKRNPINFENVKSFWKSFMPRMITAYSDQISEHQRDLTNSASQRFYTEVFFSLVISIERLLNTMKALKIDEMKMKENFDKTRSMIPAEPLYILLSKNNVQNAHEKVKKLTLKSEETGESLFELAKKDREISKIMKTFKKKELGLILNPEKYTGIAEKKTVKICSHWKKQLKNIRKA